MQGILISSGISYSDNRKEEEKQIVIVTWLNEFSDDQEEGLPKDRSLA